MPLGSPAARSQSQGENTEALVPSMGRGIQEDLAQTVLTAGFFPYTTYFYSLNYQPLG